MSHCDVIVIGAARQAAFSEIYVAGLRALHSEIATTRQVAEVPS